MGLAIPKLPAEAGAGAVIAAGERRRRLIVPIAVKGNIPGKIAPQFDVIRGVEVEMDAAGLSN